MIYLQISSGRGPAECHLAVRHICRKMVADGPGARVVHLGEQSSVVGFDGPGAEDYARQWEGTLLWVCKNPLNLRGRERKNWYVGVNRIALPEMAEVSLQEKDLVWETMRASGKGGQHVNKTETKVRLSHIPSGTVVVSEHQRSQKQNKATALSLLKQKLQEREKNVFAALDSAKWMQHNQLERGNPVRTFDGPDFRERRTKICAIG